jgi:2-(1,2-epoxy-1,2-dihydrophenyl)acetyl-CoA isomerase
MGYQLLQLERQGHVAIIRLDRPDILNALNRQLTQEFHDALDEVGAEFPDIRALIITGNGRAFCSGDSTGDDCRRQRRCGRRRVFGIFGM